MVRETLLDRVPVPPVHVLRMEGEHPDPDEAARRYETRLRELFPGAAWPALDLALLGVGADGHTASLFPGSPVLEERSRWVAAARAPVEPSGRLTLTIPVFRAARAIVFLVSGAAKAKVVAEAFGGTPHPKQHPCEIAAPRGRTVDVLVDVGAVHSMPPAVRGT
jgi:6-phosphogluconolactonase